jgi:hypothetical protein
MSGVFRRGIDPSIGGRCWSRSHRTRHKSCGTFAYSSWVILPRRMGSDLNRHEWVLDNKRLSMGSQLNANHCRLRSILWSWNLQRFSFVVPGETPMAIGLYYLAHRKPTSQTV